MNSVAQSAIDTTGCIFALDSSDRAYITACAEVSKNREAIHGGLHSRAMFLASQPLSTTMRTVVRFLATGAYLGYTPLAPGTAGSVLGLILGKLIAPFWVHSAAAFVMLFAVLFAGACLVAGAAEKLYGEHDASIIVIDEVFGMVAAMCFNPTGWIALLAAFALFRVFDIVKPWPAHRFDRMSGGVGVMLDDLAAGIYANLVLQIVRRLI
jgi:phosphatidylglycerophosphatase A